MDWVVSAVISGLILMLTLLLGGPDAKKESCPRTQPEAVQQDCPPEGEEPAPVGDEGRIPPLIGSHAVFSSAEGVQEAQR